MKGGGVLDGFPIFLTWIQRARGSVLVIDDQRLGVLRFDGVPRARDMVVVVGTDATGVRRSVDAVARGKGRVYGAVAREDQLCFRDGAFAVSVILGSRQRKPTTTLDYKGSRWKSDIGRVMQADGAYVEVAAGAGWNRKGRLSGRESALATTYHVRAISSSAYLMTRDVTPDAATLRMLHAGVLSRLRLMGALVALRLGMRWVWKYVAVIVKARGAQTGRSRAVAARLLDGEVMRGSDRGGVLFVRTGWNAVVIGRSDEDPVYKFPLHPLAAQALARHAYNVARLRGSLPDHMLSLVPGDVEHKSYGPQEVWTEGRMGEVIGSRYWLMGRRQKETAQRAQSFLVNLHRNTARWVRLSERTVVDLLSSDCEVVTREGRRVDEGFELSEMISQLQREFRRVRMPLVWTHGDFWAGNLCMGRSGELRGVLDWDASVEHGWPLIDLIHLIVSRYRWRANVQLGQLVAGKLMSSDLRGWERELIRSYCQEMKIDTKLWRGFVAVYWIGRVGHWGRTDLQHMAGGLRWIKRNIVDAAPRIAERLSRQ